MRREHSTGSAGLRILSVSRRIAARRARRLFVRFCGEAGRLSDRIEIEVAPFEIAFRDPGSGFCVFASPLRDLFVVSVGESRSLDVRVSSDESFVSALDLVLERYLSAAATASGAA